jgi:hypothetical protein
MTDPTRAYRHGTSFRGGVVFHLLREFDKDGLFYKMIRYKARQEKYLPGLVSWEGGAY